MSYRSKVLLGAFLVYLLFLVPSMIRVPGTGAAQEVGLLSIMVCITEAALLTVIAIVIRIAGRTTEVRRGDGDLETLDGGELGPTRPLSPARKAGAWFLAAGLILLVGVSVCFGSLAVS